MQWIQRLPRSRSRRWSTPDLDPSFRARYTSVGWYPARSWPALNLGLLPAIQIETMSQTAEAQQLLRDIQSRHEDIIKLEESLKELRQLFLDMQALVEAQGEVLNEIENSVDSAVDFTTKGLDEMKKAVKYQKSARKVRTRPSFPSPLGLAPPNTNLVLLSGRRHPKQKQLILMCCVICMLLCIVIPIGIVFGKK